MGIGTPAQLETAPAVKSHLYILDARGEPQPIDDALEWARWYETADRHVAHDMDEGDRHGLRIRVSTVFLGIDHNHFGDGPPILWETMVFGGLLDGTQRRYESRADAYVGHQEICARVRESMK